MSFSQEWSSWTSSLKNTVTSVPPSIGDKAPHVQKLDLESGKASIVVFLRHCGCPFAEKTFLRLRETARKHHDMDFYAISHSNEQATQNWLKALPQSGSESSNLKVIVDDQREIYGAWGLGASSWAHVLSPSALYEVYKVATEEGITNRPTESGSRWQQSGFFAVNADGIVKWGRPAESAPDVPDFEEAVSAVV